MTERCKGVLRNGMDVQIMQTDSMLTEEVILNIGGVGCEIFQISSAKRNINGKPTRGFLVSPRVKKAQFIAIPEVLHKEASLEDVV